MADAVSWLVLLPWAALTAHTIVNTRFLRRPHIPAGPVGAGPVGAGPVGAGPVGAGPVGAGPVRAVKIAVLLPLRNEADRVTPCLTALLGQRGVPGLTIHVLDDGSTDGTAALVSRLTSGAARVRLHHGEPLPAGWLGKPHACHQLATAAIARDNPDILAFVDADVVLEPDAIAAAAALLRHTGVTLLSPYPRITGAGRLVQPLLQWSWLTFLPLRAMERSPRPSLAAAGGQWLLTERAGYERAGGHTAVRADILEDIGLARAVKRTGGRIALADGSRLATCRMYPDWPTLTSGYTKSLWASFGSGPAAGAVVVTLLLLYAVPPLAALVLLAAGVLRAALICFTAYLLGVLGRVVTAAATGGRAWPDALLHPASVLVFAWLVARSFQLRRRGALLWRGRPV
jgi:glycosyl transferase family 2